MEINTKELEVTPTKKKWSYGLSVRAANAIFWIYSHSQISQRSPYGTHKDLRSFNLDDLTPEQMKTVIREDVASRDLVLKRVRQIGKKTFNEIMQWVGES